MKTSSNLVT